MHAGLVTRTFPLVSSPLALHDRARVPRLLVVEDDVDLRPVFRRVFRALQPRVALDWARGVDEAIALLRRRRHRYVLADYMLEDGTGLAIRRWLEYFAPRVVFAYMSALPLRQELGAGAATQAAFLAKPFSVDELRSFVGELTAARA